MITGAETGRTARKFMKTARGKNSLEDFYIGTEHEQTKGPYSDDIKLASCHAVR
jgi:hypothetical protein